MPSLLIFGRRWSISSDDFVFPEITEALIRLVWFVASFIIYVTRAQNDACLNLHLFLVITLVINSIVIAMCIATAYVSSLGTILNGSARRNLPILLYARCPLIVFEIAWNITGCFWLEQSDKHKCDWAFLAGALVIILGGWCMLVVLLIGIVINFDPLGNIHHGDVKMTDEAKKLWKNRIRLACICASTGDKAKMAFEDVAELFVDLFSDSDLVWTDVWAAMLLLANKEMRVLNERPRGLVDKNAPPWMNVQDASRVMRFALGVYGWPYYMVGRGCSIGALCDLARRGRCCAATACRCDSAVVIKDNCCMCNTAALLLQTGLQETDLFYVNLHNEICETPFVACFDHSMKSIVISIRGSLSMRDALTDLTATEDTLELDSCLTAVDTPDVQTSPPPLLSFSNPNRKPSVSSESEQSQDTEITLQCIKCRAHRGMLLSARYVASKLETEHILEDMFVLQPRYDLILTGHSLGAGVASLLAVLLKPKYPGLKCYAFSPPGCVISEEGAEFTKSFVYSILWGDDLVPHLSKESIRNLKQNVFDVLINCDRPKYSILLKGCYKLFCAAGGIGSRGRRAARPSTFSSDDSRPASPTSTLPPPLQPLGASSSMTALLTSAATPTTPEYAVGADAVAVKLYDDSNVEAAAVNGCASPLLTPVGRTTLYTEEQKRSHDQRVRLVCPGRVMHLRRSRDRYVMRWTHPDRLSQVRMSSSMLSDHMPWTVSRVLLECASESNADMA